MTTVLPTVTALLAPAVDAAARNLMLDEAVTPAADDVDGDFSAAVIVSFSGSVSGEIALAIDAGVVSAFQAASSAAIDVQLRPAVDAVAALIGGVAIGRIEQIDPRMAFARVANHVDSGKVMMIGSAGPRAGLAIGMDAGSGEAATVAARADRLDLLRGVEMQASAELGRARMTIDELLSLQTGAVVELDRAAGDPADLYVNGRLIAQGEVVVVDENYALRITHIVTTENGR